MSISSLDSSPVIKKTYQYSLRRVIGLNAQLHNDYIIRKGCGKHCAGMTQLERFRVLNGMSYYFLYRSDWNAVATLEIDASFSGFDVRVPFFEFGNMM